MGYNPLCRRCTGSISAEEHCQLCGRTYEYRDSPEDAKAVRTPLNGSSEKEPNASPTKADVRP